MAQVVFYEKPGCAGNAQQRAMLSAAGHQLEVRDLLSTPWTAATLRPFFGELPVAEWFNPRAPAVRDRQLVPAQLDEASALAAMIATPILIRRPLLQSGSERRCGFDPQTIDRWLGLLPADVRRAGVEACQSTACP
jgi:nitrogenase-associated protein